MKETNTITPNFTSFGIFSCYNRNSQRISKQKPSFLQTSICVVWELLCSLDAQQFRLNMLSVSWPIFDLNSVGSSFPITNKNEKWISFVLAGVRRLFLHYQEDIMHLRNPGQTFYSLEICVQAAAFHLLLRIYLE
jgi:hypothetical protein